MVDCKLQNNTEATNVEKGETWPCEYYPIPCIDHGDVCQPARPFHLNATLPATSPTFHSAPVTRQLLLRPVTQPQLPPASNTIVSENAPSPSQTVARNHILATNVRNHQLYPCHRHVPWPATPCRARNKVSSLSGQKRGVTGAGQPCAFSACRIDRVYLSGRGARHRDWGLSSGAAV